VIVTWNCGYWIVIIVCSLVYGKGCVPSSTQHFVTLVEKGITRRRLEAGIVIFGDLVPTLVLWSEVCN
jgi:hypothetical protein